VHPVTLVYRTDLIEKLGIDVSTLRTWDDFVTMGRRVTRDLDGDGTLDRFALDLPVEGAQGLSMLLLQRGARYFDANGQVAFNSEQTVQTIAWYVRQLHGPDRIAFDAGFGQTTGKALSDGLVLFFFCPDWRSRVFEREVPNMKGKMGMVPLPAWHEGGPRTSVWGGTGMVLSRRSKNVELAWELAKFLYFEPHDLASRFRETNIIPPLEDVWSSGAFDEPNPYYSGQRIGRLYASLAPEVPPVYSAPTYRATYLKVDEVLARATLHYKKFGEKRFLQTIRSDLVAADTYIQRLASRSRRISEDG
jgi:arabinosaccharide transport system substrate-binding protein